MQHLSQRSRTAAISILSSLALIAAMGFAPAFADGHGGDHGNGSHGDDSQAHACINPAGHQRGWCGKDDNGNNQGTTTISGTVLGFSNNTMQFRLDSGQVINVNTANAQNSGISYAIGSHYTLTGRYVNGVFFVNNNNNNNNNNYNGSNSTASVRGIITSVSGNTVTLLQGLSTVTINDQTAINNNQANNLYVTRTVTAYGYWNNGTFYATSIQ